MSESRPSGGGKRVIMTCNHQAAHKMMLRVQCVSLAVCVCLCALQLCLSVNVSVNAIDWQKSPQLLKYRECAEKVPSRNTVSGVAPTFQRGGRLAGRLCEVFTQQERTRDKLLVTASWPPFLELIAHTGVGLRWARVEETWQAGSAEEVRAGWWAAERRRNEAGNGRKEGRNGGMGTEKLKNTWGNVFLLT